MFHDDYTNGTTKSREVRPSHFLLNLLRPIVEDPKALWLSLAGVLSAFPGIFPVQSQVRIAFFDSSVVNDTVIRLVDIARIEGTDSGVSLDELKQRPVGEAAPAGYSRFVNSTDAFLYGQKIDRACMIIDKSRCKRILVKTGYQEKRIGDFEDAIVKYLGENICWRRPEYTVSVLNKNDAWKCLRRPFLIKIIGLDSKYPRGNFNVKLIAEQGSKKYVTPVSCFIQVVIPVVVSKTNISRGEILTSENCSIEERDITHFNYRPFNTLSDIKNFKSSRSIQTGTIICDQVVVKIPIIERDDMVQVVVTHGRVRVCMSARARESGSVGEKIWVENEISHKLLKTMVVSHGKVVLLDGEGTI